jgi:putative ABC transport system substrate-binding protein
MATVALGLALLAAPLAAAAQPPGKARRIGVLSGRSLRSERDPLREGLRELGWVEGQNLVLEYRTAVGQLNLRTAKALGVVIPQSVLIQADDVIQ